MRRVHAKIFSLPHRCVIPGTTSVSKFCVVDVLVAPREINRMAAALSQCVIFPRYSFHVAVVLNEDCTIRNR